MNKSKNDGESILINYSMVVLLKTWMILPFSVRICIIIICTELANLKLKEALKRMKSRKAVGPDGIPIEV